MVRYWWEHLEDCDGFLVECALQPDEWGLKRLTEVEFEAAWDSGGTDPASCD